MVLLPEGSELTLTELRDIAARQQQQIEAQQQLLVAKEQRLKFLKQQEARHHQGTQVTEGEKLRPLRDKVETQEIKLRRLRALRGQAEQQRSSNNNLTAELESIRALFNEKEKELSLAVAKVEELTRQLEELRRGNANGDINPANNPNALAVVELEKLRREVLYRTKLNEQQNARILQQRESLAKRQEEISLVDQRIASLQQRLHRKRTLNQTLASQIHAATLAKQAQIHSSGSHHNLNENTTKPTTATRIIRPHNTNIAAVEPLKRVPQDSERCQDDIHATLKPDEDLSEFLLYKNDPKYQTLPYNTKFLINKTHSRDNSIEDNPEKPIAQTSPIAENENLSVKTTEEKSEPPSQSYMSPSSNQSQHSPDSVPPPPPSVPPPSNKVPTTANLSNLAPRPFGSTYSSSLTSHPPTANTTIYQPQLLGQLTNPSEFHQTSNNNPCGIAPAYKHPPLSPHFSNGSKMASKSKLPMPVTGNQFQQTPTNFKTSVGTTSSSPSSTTTTSKSELSPQSQTSPQNRSSSSPPQTRTPELNDSSSLNSSLSSQESHHSLNDSLDKSKPALPPKPLLPVKPVPPPRQTHVLGVVGGNGTKKSDVDSALMVLKGTGNRNTKSGNGYRYVMKPSATHGFGSRLPLGPAAMDQYAKAINHVYRNEMQQVAQQNNNSNVSDSSPHESEGSGSTESPLLDSDNANSKKSGAAQLPIQPRPLTIKKPSGLDPPRLRSNLSSGGGSTSQLKSSSPSSQLTHLAGLHVNSNRRNVEGNSPNYAENFSTGVGSKYDRLKGEDKTDRSAVTTGTMVTSSNRRSSKSREHSEDELSTERFNVYSTSEDNGNNDGQQIMSDLGTEEESDATSDVRKHQLSDLTSESSQPDGESEDSFPIIHHNNSAVFRRVKKGNLKVKGTSKNPRRVSFDPLALLLDASLEGELELVRKTAKEVTNPSAANDEGITALHNAICAGHLEIVKFLVEFGCDVNAQDSDGWTPLHCAASCNNLPMVKFLVEHGACIFATTLSDHETAAEKCEEDEEGFDGCSEYLYSIQEKLGIMNAGAVYGVYDYEALNPDELSFKEGEMAIVLRKGDDLEREWWWSKLRDREGYIPRNLLGLHPRVNASKDS